MNSTPEIRKAAALIAVESGYSVLPVTGGQKSATGNTKLGLKSGEGGVNNASRERAAVEGWFKRWPKTNYGIACGIKSGVWVLDVDDQELADSSLPWNTVDLTEKTFSVKTPHGWHIYFRLPLDLAEMRSYSKKKTNGVEVKADGTYVLGPWCIAKDEETGSWGEYKPWNELEPMEAPAGVWEWVLANAPQKRARRDLGDAEAEGRELDPEGNCFDDFNLNANFPLYLERKGWTLVREGEPSHWCRPGKEHGVSATLGWAQVGEEGIPLFHVFTSSVEELEQDRSYTPAGVFIELEAGGESKPAQVKLRQMGFGVDRRHLRMAFGRQLKLPGSRPTSASFDSSESELFDNLVNRARAELIPVSAVISQHMVEMRQR